MDRRRLLIAGGGIVGAVAGGTALADATRADLLVDRELTQGTGEPVATQQTITRDAVDYLASTDAVREHGETEPFTEWARREGQEIAADTVVSVVESRVEGPLDGVGSGVRFLLFGPVITVDHLVTHDRTGTVVNEPTVTFNRLITVTPRTMTVTVTLDGHDYTTTFPVGVGQSDLYMD